MANDDFFRSRLDQMIDLRHPLVVLASRIPWSQLEAALAPAFSRHSSGCATAIARLNTLLERAERIRTQQAKDKNKLHALHAPEVECISKGEARKRYEFGVKASIVVTHKSGLVVGARTFPGNPYDGHVLSAQLEQTNILLEDAGKSSKQVFADLGYRGVDRDNPNVEIIHRGKYRSLTQQQRRCLRRRPAVEPTIGHLKADHRMDRC
jgi:IS5 family transposase